MMYSQLSQDLKTLLPYKDLYVVEISVYEAREGEIELRVIARI